MAAPRVAGQSLATLSTSASPPTSPKDYSTPLPPALHYPASCPWHTHDIHASMHVVCTDMYTHMCLPVHTCICTQMHAFTHVHVRTPTHRRFTDAHV